MISWTFAGWISNDTIFGRKVHQKKESNRAHCPKKKWKRNLKLTQNEKCDLVSWKLVSYNRADWFELLRKCKFESLIEVYYAQQIWLWSLSMFEKEKRSTWVRSVKVLCKVFGGIVKVALYEIVVATPPINVIWRPKVYPYF